MFCTVYSSQAQSGAIVMCVGSCADAICSRFDAPGVLKRFRGCARQAAVVGGESWRFAIRVRCCAAKPVARVVRAMGFEASRGAFAGWMG
jgi:hypothetical protein